MPTHQHAQPPNDDRPPPCDCGGCREFRAIHGRLCPEPPAADRLTKRETDRAAQRRYEDHLADTLPQQRGAA